MRATLYNKTCTQGDQGEPGDRGPSGDEYISQSPPPQLTVVPGPKGDQGQKGQKGHIGNQGSKGVVGDRVSLIFCKKYYDCLNKFS